MSPVTITRLEHGQNQPDDETLTQLANKLGYPVNFFHGEDPEEIDLGAVSFRSLSKMSAKERDAAVSASSLAMFVSDWLETNFNLPPVNLIDLSYETNPSAAARSLRQFWNLGERPVPNMLRLLETQGVRVFSLSENTATVDAYSFWRDSKPFVFLNNFKTAEHSVFDAAHELGHLVLHRHAGPGGSRFAEREANEFASAFLMPENDVRARLIRPIGVNTVIRAKVRWRVSAMALAYRLRAVELVSVRQYKHICIELGRRGYRSGEPNGIERETSAIWSQVLSQLWREKTTKQQIADSLNIPIEEFESLVGGVLGVSRKRSTPYEGVYLRQVK